MRRVEVNVVRAVVVIGCLVFALAGGARPAGADLLQDLGATYQKVAEELAATFPRVEARITSIDGDVVRLEGGDLASLRPGLELAAFRKGEIFRHPVTNQALGRAEVELGTLVVTAVGPDGVVARRAKTEGSEALRPGDGARLTFGRLPVAVLPTEGVSAPFERADQTALLLVARFSAFLEKTGRFLAVQPQKVLDLTGPGGQTLAPLEAARKLDAPAVLSSRLVREGPHRHLDTQWISAKTGVVLVELRTPLVRASFSPRFAWEQTPELERRLPLGVPVRGLAAADVDGDGRVELVVAEERAVALYHWQEGTGLLRLGTALADAGGIILSVDAADLNGSGRAQVVVVSHSGIAGLFAIRSRVLELHGTEVRTLYDVPGRYLRVVSVGSERWLVEQRAGEQIPFEPSITRLLWQEGRYRDGGTLKVPRDVSVYGVALMRLSGSAEPDIVALTPEDRLAVWTAEGRRIWTSPDPYGGSAITFQFEPLGLARNQTGIEFEVSRVLGRVIPLPVGADGPELLVFENLLPLGGQARGLLPRTAALVFNRGRIHRLRWKDGAFIRAWQSTTTDGYVADFAYADLDGDGATEVAVAVVPRGFTLDTLIGAKANLLLYDLPQ